MKYVLIPLLSILTILFFWPKEPIIIGKDDYAFHSKEFENKQVLVTVVTFKTWDEFRAEVKRQKLPLSSNDGDIIAFSVVDKDDKRFCTIYMIDPETQYLPEYTGHEFFHCLYGQWHINNDSRGY